MRELGVLLRWLALSLPLLATAASMAQSPDLSRHTHRLIPVNADCRFPPAVHPPAPSINPQPPSFRTARPRSSLLSASPSTPPITTCSLFPNSPSVPAPSFATSTRPASPAR